MNNRKHDICVDEEVKIGIQLAISRFLEDDGETGICVANF